MAYRQRCREGFFFGGGGGGTVSQLDHMFNNLSDCKVHFSKNTFKLSEKKNISTDQLFFLLNLTHYLIHYTRIAD